MTAAGTFAGGASGRSSVGMRIRHTIRDRDDRIIFSGGRVGDDLHVDLWNRGVLSPEDGTRIADAIYAMVAEG